MNVSIIIPVYNQEDLVIRALDSIPRRDDIEVIVVDDCSTDNTLMKLRSYSRIPIGVKNLNKNMGTSYAKNVGLNCATGKGIYILDSDDYLINFNNILDKLDEYNFYDVVYVANEVNNGEIGTGIDRVAPGSYFIKKKFLDDNNIRYNDTLRRAEDFTLMNTISDHNPKIINTKILCYHYNFPRNGSICGNGEHLGTDENIN